MRAQLVNLLYPTASVIALLIGGWVSSGLCSLRTSVPRALSWSAWLF